MFQDVLHVEADLLSRMREAVSDFCSVVVIVQIKMMSGRSAFNIENYDYGEE